MVGGWWSVVGGLWCVESCRGGHGARAQIPNELGALLVGARNHDVGAVTWTSPRSHSTASALPSASQQLTRGGTASGPGEGHNSRAAGHEQCDDGMQASLAQRRMLVVAREVVCEVGGRRGRAYTQGKGWKAKRKEGKERIGGGRSAHVVKAVIRQSRVDACVVYLRRGKGKGIKSAKWRSLVRAQWVRAENGRDRHWRKEGKRDGVDGGRNQARRRSIGDWAESLRRQIGIDGLILEVEVGSKVQRSSGVQRWKRTGGERSGRRRREYMPHGILTEGELPSGK
ncbi:hypothetical protein DFH08DRAFT_806219 [Mycena albidolilacea]|uniref:Uncharacterized protein n=1 Tax=Mycena albidolilacea TaxID=1033008 RepID=A0AAD7EW80_9AGAR|nr:hypothetical protein DFH08DRAFT_806219 [Mycena albidolilacea]